MAAKNAGKNAGKKKETAGARRRLEEQKRKKAKNRKMAAIAIGLVAVIAVIALYALMSGGGNQGPSPTDDSPPGEGGEVRMLMSNVTATPKWYSYDSSGVTVRYFAVKGTDGNIHIATDACDVCYSAHKGYRQDGTFMACNNCGKTFAINGIGTENVGGGCWPSYLPWTNKDGYVVINTSDLDGKRFMFS